MTRAVLLDVDDTLLDTTAAIVTAASVAMAALWPHLDPRQAREAALRFRTDPGGAFRRFTEGSISFEQMRGERLGEVADHAGLILRAGSLDRFEAAYRPAFLDAQRVFADVPAFLSTCRETGLAVGALTNSSGSVTADKLDRVGGAGWFDVVITRDTLGFGKPDPRVFAHACSALRLPAQEVLMVGDEWEPDVLGALDAGLQACWLIRGPGGRGAEGSGDLPRAPEAYADRIPVVAGLTELADRLDLGTGRGAR